MLMPNRQKLIQVGGKSLVEEAVDDRVIFRSDIGRFWKYFFYERDPVHVLQIFVANNVTNYCEIGMYR